MRHPKGDRWWLLVFAVTLASLGCRDRRESLPADDADGSREGAAVTLAKVQARRVQRTVEAVGTLVGYEEVTLSAKVEGRVRRVLHDVADRVEPGAPLLEIDSTEHELAVRQAERALEVECARLGISEPPGPDFDVTKVPQVIQTQAQLENARDRLDRVRTLAAKQAATKEELTDKTAAYRVAKAELDAQVLMARSSAAAARMKAEALAMARQQLSETVIRAPIPTRPIPGSTRPTYAVTARMVAEGTYVRPGTEVFRLVVENPLKLRSLVPERHAAEIRLNQPATLFTAASPHPSRGTVARINPAVDPVSRTFEVEITAPNPNGDLKPGGFAKASIVIRDDSQAITVPLEAVLTFAGVTKLFLFEEGTAKQVLVATGVQGPDWVEIDAPPLTPGAKVITSGQALLFDGAPVRERVLAPAAPAPSAKRSPGPMEPPPKEAEPKKSPSDKKVAEKSHS